MTLFTNSLNRWRTAVIAAVLVVAAPTAPAFGQLGATNPVVPASAGNTGPTRDDKRAAAIMTTSLSTTLITGELSLFAFFGAFFVFLGDRHDLASPKGRRGVIFAGLAILLGLTSVIFGGQGINNISIEGFSSEWQRFDRLFIFQTYLSFGSILLMAASLISLISAPRVKNG